MITMLKKTREKKYIWTRHKNEGRRCVLIGLIIIITIINIIFVSLSKLNFGGF